MKIWTKWQKKRLGVAAPKVIVSTRLPWYFQSTLILGLVIVVGCVGLVTYHFGSEFAGFHHSESNEKITRLTALNEDQLRQLGEIRQTLIQTQNQVKIDAASIADLTHQMQTLVADNVALKADLAFFQSLLPVSGKDGALVVSRFKLVPEVTSGSFRYRLLLAQEGQRPIDFKGNFTLILRVQKGSEQMVLRLPDDKTVETKAFELNFKSYQRLEGLIRLAPGSQIKGIDIQVYQKGNDTPKLTQSLKF